jgi:hypothetical protein
MLYSKSSFGFIEKEIKQLVSILTKNEKGSLLIENFL